MKFAVFIALLGLTRASVIPVPVTKTQFHAQDELGQYSFGYVEGNSAKHEVKTADGVTRGGYSYVDANGLIQNTEYIADPIHGFRVASTNLGGGAIVGASHAVVAPHTILAGGPTIVASAPAVVASAPVAVHTGHAFFASPVAPVITGISTTGIATTGIVSGSEEASSSSASDDSVAVEAAVKSGATEEEAPAPEPEPTPAPEEMPAPEETPAPAPEEIPAPAPAPEETPELPGPAPEPVTDTADVAHARLAHLAAVEDTKARNALIENSKHVVSETFIASAPAVVSAPAVSIAATSRVLAGGPAILAGGHGLLATRIAGPALYAGPQVVAAAPSLVATRVAAPVAVAAGPAVVATRVATPIAVAAAPIAPLTTASQYHAQDELGQYRYGYAGGPSAKDEIKTFDGITRGGYSYLDANGIVQTASYVSDPVNGFRIAATNLPVQTGPQYIPDTPEVAEAKAALLKAQAEHVAKL